MTQRHLQVMVTLAPTSLDDLKRCVRLAEDAGVDAVGIGDSPGYHDTYVSLAVAAGATSRVRIGPFVTNAITRDPFVTARALASIDDLAGGGRTFVGIGAGDSALTRRGTRPLPVDQFRDRIDEIKTGWADSGGEPGQVFVAANGPRTQRMAAAHADVVVSGGGCDPATLGRFIGLVDGARPEASPCEPWVVCRVSIDDDEDAAISELLPLLASGANHTFAVPRELDLVNEHHREPLTELLARYDYATHGRRHDNPNAALVDELGLRDFLMSRFALAGSSEKIVTGLRALADQGAAGIVIPAVGLDTERLLERLGSHVIPALRRH